MIETKQLIKLIKYYLFNKIFIINTAGQPN